jgi:hypothetical protein
MNLILLFLFFLSLTHLIAIIVNFIFCYKELVKFTLDKYEKIGLYLSIAYILAFIFQN